MGEIPTGEPLILIGKSIPGTIGFEFQFRIRVKDKVLVFPRQPHAAVTESFTDLASVVNAMEATARTCS